MLDFAAIDPTYDTDPDPLTTARARLAEAREALDIAIYAAGLTGEELTPYYADINAAGAALEALHRENDTVARAAVQMNAAVFLESVAEIRDRRLSEWRNSGNTPTSRVSP